MTAEGARASKHKSRHALSARRRPRHRSLRAASLCWLGVPVVLVASVMVSVTPSALASPPPQTFSIVGGVTDHGGTPLQGICVTAYSVMQINGVLSPGAPAGGGMTDANGKYQVESLAASPSADPQLPEGSYLVQFEDCTNHAYVEQWYTGTLAFQSATQVTTTTGSTVTLNDVTLAVGGAIDGTVTDSATTAGLSCVTVEAYTNPATFVGETITSATGQYHLSGLPAGQVEVSFSQFANQESANQGCGNGFHIEAVYGTQTDNLQNGTPVSVTAGGDTPGIDDTLVLGGLVGGTVTDSNGNPKPGVCVDIVVPDANGGIQTVVGGAQTQPNGTWQSNAIAAGTYKVSFALCAGGQPFDWYNAKPDITSADDVQVVAGQLTNNVNSGRNLAVPDPPANVTAAPANANGVVNLSWQPPTNSGSNPVTSYTIAQTPPGTSTTMAPRNLSSDLRHFLTTPSVRPPLRRWAR